MSQKNDLNVRLAVGNINDANSAILRVWSPKGKSDIYVGVREIAGKIKISFHETGECFAGLTYQFFSKQEGNVKSGIGSSRHQSKWIRQTQVGSKVVTPFQFTIPMSELRVWRQNQNPAISEKEIIWIEPSASDRSIIVSCVFSGQQLRDDEWPGRQNQTHLVASKCLPNGEKFWLLWQDCPTSALERSMLLEASKIVVTRNMIPFSGRDVNETPPRRLIFKECFQDCLLVVLDGAAD